MYLGIIAYSICDIAISRELKAAYLCNIRLRQLKAGPKRYEKEFINFSRTADIDNDIGTERRNHYEEV